MRCNLSGGCHSILGPCSLKFSPFGTLQELLLLLDAGKRLQAEVRRSLYGERASSGFSSAASGAMGTVSAVWSFISAEAATEGSLAPEDAALLPPPPKLDISVCLSVLSGGKHLTFALHHTQVLLLDPCSLQMHQC